jgi:hypothetical protein
VEAYDKWVESGNFFNLFRKFNKLWHEFFAVIYRKINLIYRREHKLGFGIPRWNVGVEKINNQCYQHIEEIKNSNQNVQIFNYTKILTDGDKPSKI